MDDFLRNIHTIIFKQWILNQTNKDYHLYLDKTNPNIIIIETAYSYSQIIFNEMDIIELSVTNTTNHEPEFYLHFQMQTIKHAIELFYEMLECIKKLVHKPITKILFSCSGGLTTSFFANKMNEASKLLFLDYEASAVSYNELFNVGAQYDVILLAPQISYKHAKVQEILKNKIVLKIPPQTFAKYDVGKILSLIQNAKQDYNHQTSQFQRKPIPIQKDIRCQNKILSLSIFRNSERVHIAYRLYGENNRILLNNEIIKNKVVIRDLYDVIDTVLLQFSDLKVIGISLPGIINDGYVTSANVNGLEDIDLLSLLSSRYTQKIVLGNDVNTAAVGYYASQNQYSSLTFLFQPISFFAGAGVIINGELIAGKNNLAGEIQYLPMNLSDDYLKLNKTPEGSLELVSKIIICIMSIISPEAIALCCELIPQIDDLKKEMAHYIPEQYIPPIIKIDNALEYTIVGQMILCLQSLDE